jgi:hypothetical protein
LFNILLLAACVHQLKVNCGVSGKKLPLAIETVLSMFLGPLDATTQAKLIRGMFVKIL